MPKAIRVCQQCGKRVGTWWLRDDKSQCGNCTLSDLADEGIITKGQPHTQGWAGYHQRRREDQQGSAR